jgi:hypothetical protein
VGGRSNILLPRALLCAASLALFAGLAPSPVAAAGLPAGKHCFASKDSTLTLTARANGTAAFSVLSSEGNGHVCGLEGEAQATEGGYRYTEKIAGEGDCRLDIFVAGNGSVQFKDRGWICRLRYCGARASLDGLTFRRGDKKRC